MKRVEKERERDRKKSKCKSISGHLFHDSIFAILREKLMKMEKDEAVV